MSLWRKLYVYYCPFMDKCPYANPLCFGIRMLSCEHYVKYEEELRRELEEIRRKIEELKSLPKK